MKYLAKKIHGKPSKERNRISMPEFVRKKGFRYKKFDIMFVPREVMEKNIWFGHKLGTLIWLVANYTDVHPRDIIYATSKIAGEARRIVIFCAQFTNLSFTAIHKWAMFNGLTGTAWAGDHYNVIKQFRETTLQDPRMVADMKELLRLLDRRKMIDLRRTPRIGGDDPISAGMDFDTPPDFWREREFRVMGYVDGGTIPDGK